MSIKAKHYSSNPFVPNPDPHWVKETLVEDLNESQKENNFAPTPVDNEKFIIGVLEDLDRKEADQKRARDKNRATAPKDGKDAKTIIENDIEFPAKLLRGDEVTKRKRPKRAHSPRDRRMIARWKLLMGLPEWRERILAAYHLGVWTTEQYGGGPAVYAKKASQILEDSNKVFGDWDKEPERRIIFS